MAGSVVTCTSSVSAGELEGNGTMKLSALVSFKGCEGENLATKEKCKVRSPGEAAGIVSSALLTGKLGLVNAVEAVAEVGLELENSTELTTLEGNCLPVTPSKVTGKITGEVKPVNAQGQVGELVFALAAGKQKIKEVCTALPFPCGAGGGDKPKLTAFGLPAVLETTEALAFEERFEVKAV